MKDIKLMDLLADKRLVSKETTIIVSKPSRDVPDTEEIRSGDLSTELIAEWGREVVDRFLWTNGTTGGTLTVILKK